MKTSSGGILPINDSSSNWAGVVDYRETPDGVRFSWVQGVLQTDCDVNQGYSGPPEGYSSWVGIGGVVYGGALWQAGWDGVKGIFWYELVGGLHPSIHEQPITIRGAACNQTAQVYISNDYDVPTGLYVSFVDVNTGGWNSYSDPYLSKYIDTETGEWIDERPDGCNRIDSSGNGLFQLMDYGRDNWTGAVAGYNDGSPEFYAEQGSWHGIYEFNVDTSDPPYVLTPITVINQFNGFESSSNFTDIRLAYDSQVNCQ